MYILSYLSYQASWDEPTQTVVMHRGAEPSLLQSLALQLADKVIHFLTQLPRFIIIIQSCTAVLAYDITHHRLGRVGLLMLAPGNNTNM